MKHKGFTLIELLVVVAVIGVLATVVLASLGSAREKARDAKRKQDIRTIQNALELYFIDNGTYPNTSSISSDSPVHEAASSNDSWDTLGTTLGDSLPVDPVNSGTAANVHINGNYVYTYRSLSGEAISCSNKAYRLKYRIESTETMIEVAGGITC